MFSVAHELKASYAFIERNFFLTRRYWGWEVAFLVYSVAGALSISLIGADQGSPRLILLLMVGAIFWNYLSVVFSWIAETISVERWEGTLEYTMMAPIRRWAQLLGSVLYAMVYGLVHTGVILIVLILFFPQLDLSGANPPTVVAFMLLGSFSFVGIGMIAAILPLLYVERGAQMTFVL
jgi:ABC-2 type transport system permease protein